jgi:hypothetical protein
MNLYSSFLYLLNNNFRTKLRLLLLEFELDLRLFIFELLLQLSETLVNVLHLLEL